MHHPKHVQACVWLVAATAFWGLSFPFIRASWLLQKQLAPDISSFSFAAVLTIVRFAVAGLLIALFLPRSLRSVTALEFEQGWKMGIVSGLGIVFQMDGLAHTEASTSAFLTQFTCLLIPLWVAFRKRALPPAGVIVSCVMVLAGVAVLAHFDWRHFRMGRGEAETLLSAVFFSAQILLLEQPRYAANRVNTFTIVMFVTTAIMLAPVAAFTAPSAKAFVIAYSSGASLLLAGGIVLFCTLTAYVLMNVWQPRVTATEAGLIYCVEPIFASLFAACLPGMISRLGHIAYENEHMTKDLLVGGALITGANVLMQIAAMRKRREMRPVNERN